MLILFVLGMLAVVFAGKTGIDENITNGSVLIILITVGFMFGAFSLLKELRLKNSKVLISLTAAFFAFIIILFSIIERSAFADNIADKRAFCESFPETYYEEKTTPLLSLSYSFSPQFFGIRTDNYEIERDAVYYISEKEQDKGLILKYDVYYPAFRTNFSGALVNIRARAKTRI